MRKHAIILGLTFFALCAFAVLSGWGFFSSSRMGGGGRWLGPVWPYLMGGCAVVAAMAIFLTWLVFYSANHGYEDRIDPEGH